MSRENSLTTGEIAKYCEVNLRTVIRWLDKGEMKGYKLPGRGNNRVKVEDFLTFLNKHNMPVPEALQPESDIILIVDDEIEIARAIKRVTTKVGYTSLIASDGFQAGNLLATNKPLLMTLDLSMPGLDGFGVLKYTRSNESFSDLKILVISALGERELDRAKELGADAVLAKPFSNEELKNTIANLLGKKQS